MKHFAIDTRCPHCGKNNDTTSSMFGQKESPKNGDMTMCIGCGEWATFELTDASIQLRIPTDDEYIEIAHDPYVVAMRKAWKRVQNTPSQ